MVNYLSRYGWDYLNPAGQNAQEVVSTDPRLYGLSGAIGPSSTDSGLNPQMTRPVKSSFLNPADYADEPQSSIGQAIDDYRAHKRDDIPAMVASGVANVASMPLRMMTLEGMAGLAKDAGRIAQVPYNVLTSPEPVSTSQMVQPAADMAMMAPLGGVAAGKVAPAGKVAYSNSKEGALPGLILQGYRGHNPELGIGPRPDKVQAVFATPDEFLANRFSKRPEGDGVVSPVEMRFNNPYVVDAKGNNFDNVPVRDGSNVLTRWLSPTMRYNIDDLAREKAAAGHDGMVVKNVRETGAGSTQHTADQYAALQRGTVYDPESGSLLWSNNEKAALPGLLSAGEQPKSLMERLQNVTHEAPITIQGHHGNTGFGRQRDDQYWGTTDRSLAEKYRDDTSRFATKFKGPPNAPFVQDFEARFSDPYVYDAKGARWDRLKGGMDTSDLAARAMRDGHDGLVINNVIDPPMTGQAPSATTIAALKRGTIFDPKTGALIFSNADEAALPGLLRSASAGEQMQQPGITAYHGSPHDFDRFSMDKIGTGEGAQAYGHGLYFAENEKVAKEYRDSLAPSGLGVVARGRLRQHGGDVDATINYIKSRMDPNNPLAKDTATIAELEAMKASGKPAGHMYQVRINADPEHFLDWDKPLSQQSEMVRNALGWRGGDEAAAQRISDRINALNRVIDNGGAKADAAIKERNGLLDEFDRLDPSAASWWKNDARDYAARPDQAQRLRDAGIPGIKYLDQGSRTAGEGSRNFVVFDDKLVSIVKKYGWAGAAAMLGISADDLVSQAQAQGF